HYAAAEPGPNSITLNDLPTQQYMLIIHHLRHIITGSMQDQAWCTLRDEAHEYRFGRDRGGRMWAYFVPHPAGARVRPPDNSTVTATERNWAITLAALFLVTLGYFGWLVMTHPNTVSLVTYPIMLAAGVVAARHGLEWRYRVEQFEAKLRLYSLPRRDTPDASDKFAQRVYASFEYYFSKYTPSDVDRQDWLHHTAGLREYYYRELVVVYRESRIREERIRWLIRYLARHIRDLGVNGKFQQLRREYRVSRRTTAWCTIALVVLVPATLAGSIALLQHTPTAAAITLTVLLLSGKAGVTRWWRIL